MIIFANLYECIAIIRLNLTVTHYTGDICVNQADCIEIQVSHKFDVKKQKTKKTLPMCVDWSLKCQQTTVPKGLLQVFTFYTTFKPKRFMLLPLKMANGLTSFPLSVEKYCFVFLVCHAHYHEGAWKTAKSRKQQIVLYLITLQASTHRGHEVLSVLMY